MLITFLAEKTDKYNFLKLKIVIALRNIKINKILIHALKIGSMVV